MHKQDEPIEDFASEASDAGSRPTSAAAGQGTPAEMRRSHEASLALLFYPPLASDGFCDDSRPPRSDLPLPAAAIPQLDQAARRVGKKLLAGGEDSREEGTPRGSSAAIRAHYAPTPFTQAAAGGFNPRVSGPGGARADPATGGRGARQQGSQNRPSSQGGWQLEQQQALAPQRMPTWATPQEPGIGRQLSAGAAQGAGRWLRDSGGGLLPTPPRRGTMMFPSSREGTLPSRQLFSGWSSRRSTMQQNEEEQGKRAEKAAAGRLHDRA